MPIVLASEFNPRLVLWATILPLCAVTALDMGYAKPKKRRERQAKLKELREVHAEFIATQKKEAQEAIDLLRESTDRKTSLEQEKDGLVIIEAVYGNLQAAPELGLFTDVTIPVQALVNNSQLSMPGGHSKVSCLDLSPPIGSIPLLLVDQMISNDFLKKNPHVFYRTISWAFMTHAWARRSSSG